jgi:hypothetical protein
VPANKKTLSLTHLVLQDLLPSLPPYFPTISPNARFYRENGKTQPENLWFRHDYCGHRFNRQKEEALKNGLFGTDQGWQIKIKSP